MQVKYTILKKVLITAVLISQLPHTFPANGKVNAQQSDHCGEWLIEDNNSDSRISVSYLNDDINNTCSTSFNLANQTGLLGLHGGYTFEIVPFLFNGDAEWSPESDSGRLFLLPSISELELYATPANFQKNAEITTVGAVTVESFAIDASLFVLRTGLALVPFHCYIPDETLLFIAFELSEIFIPTSELVFQGKIVEQGTHNDLVSRQGSYYRLIKNQLELGG